MWCACDIQVTEQWATPFKIHTPPVEDFGKVYHGGVFSNIRTICEILEQVYHRGSKYFIKMCKKKKNLFT